MNHLDNHQESEVNQNQALEEYVFQSNECEKEECKPKSNFKKIISYTLVSAIIFGVVAGGIFMGMTYPMRKEIKKFSNYQEMQKNVKDSSKAMVETIENKGNLGSLNSMEDKTNIEGVVQKAMPSIVAITNQSVQEVRDIFGRGLRSYESSSAGSGIIVEENDEGFLIATNFHVIDKANTLSVSFMNNEVVKGTLRGTDPGTDLAIISVKKADLTESTLNLIKVADVSMEEDLPIGSGVVAIGNALGYGQSVTTGIVSAVRYIDFSGNGVENKWIQTDAAINPGNSGGALLDMEGKVIGINTVKLSRQAVEGMGYAISMEEAMPILRELMKGTMEVSGNESKGGFLGVTGVAVSDAAMETYDIPKGLYIVEVLAGSPASEIGLKKGDVIQGVNGQNLMEPQDLKKILSQYQPGEKVSLQVKVLTEQGYELKDIEVTLGQRLAR